MQILTSRNLYFTRDAALEVVLKEALLWIDREMAAAQTHAQTGPIISPVTFREAAFQRKHGYEMPAAQRELMYTDKLNIKV
jgi:hypothetical protein